MGRKGEEGVRGGKEKERGRGVGRKEREKQKVLFGGDIVLHSSLRYIGVWGWFQSVFFLHFRNRKIDPKNFAPFAGDFNEF